MLVPAFARVLLPAGTRIPVPGRCPHPGAPAVPASRYPGGARIPVPRRYPLPGAPAVTRIPAPAGARIPVDTQTASASQWFAHDAPDGLLMTRRKTFLRTGGLRRPDQRLSAPKSRGSLCQPRRRPFLGVGPRSLPSSSAVSTSRTARAERAPTTTPTTRPSAIRGSGNSSTTTNSRPAPPLLNVLAVPCYPQDGSYGNDDSAATQLNRNPSTRSLWDPNYVDQSWISQVGIHSGKVKLIPI